MAAELTGGSLLSGFISDLLDRMASRDVMIVLQGKKDAVKMLDELKVNLLSVNVVLDDAEEKQLTSPDVKIWLDELTHVIYRADVLMDQIDTEALRHKVEDESATAASKILNFVSTSVWGFEKAVIVEVKEILERLNLLLDQKVHLGLKEGVPTRFLQRSNYGLVVKESDVVGRDIDKEKILELLLSDDTSSNNLSVIPIVGMGGIGKTTLAQLVYQDSRVGQHFELKAWVTVSEEFDVFQITKSIYKEVTFQKCNIGDLFQLQSALHKVLARKRFLFVLDDVWNENYRRWESLESAFQSGAYGSRIIVTTRSKDVALTMSKGVMHELELVSDEDCWMVFEKHAFDDRAEAPAELQKIGLEIAKRCKGLPLAVKSLAGLLRSTPNPEEWRKVLNSDMWHLQFQENLTNDVVPALWLSYHFLPPRLKRCFAYCSIFPKDYQFGESDLKKIIRLWMAEGLLQPEKGKRIEDVGEEYLHALIARSFFQYSSRGKLVMHNIVHDLAAFISGEFYFVLGECNNLNDLPPKTRHLSYREGLEDFMKMNGLTSQAKSLRTLLALPLSLANVEHRSILEKSFVNELSLVGGCLRVLSLSGCQIAELPDSIGNMKYLRYLDLSCTEVKEIPDSICTLYNLQTLLLLRCEQLAQLPARFSALINLCHLDISDTPLKEMPPQMCNLKNLQKLSNFVLGEHGGWRIKELRELPLLGGSLCISGLEYIVDVKDVLEANLKDKKFLSELILEWRGDSHNTSSLHEREVLEALQPHANLKQLTIRGYKGTIFPDWVGHESFCNMVEVQLWYCRNVCMLPPLGQLSSLRRLEMAHLEGVVSIGTEFCGSFSTTANHPFTSLEELEISSMASWEEWSFGSDRLGQEGGVFPSLTELSIRFCNKLIVGLPDCHLPSLKSICILHCREMVGVFECQSCQEMDTNAFPSLESMSVGYCANLWKNRMKWGLERLPSLMRLSLWRIEEEVDSFPEEGLLPTTLTQLSIQNFEKLKGLNGLAFQHLTSLQKLSIGNCGELECLPQEGLPLSLSCLTIGYCPMLKQRCQRGTGEDWPKIQHIPIIDIW